MPGTGQAEILDETLMQGSSGMGAYVADCVEVAFDVMNGDDVIIDMDQLGFAAFNLADGSGGNTFG